MRHGLQHFLIQTILFIVAVSFSTQAVIAQPGELNESTQQQTAFQPIIPKPGIKPENRPTRTMQRTGTAIVGARNSISIKSTDAGIIHHPPGISAIPNTAYEPSRHYGPAASNCMNCGIIDFISRIGQEATQNAIAGGIIAGTVLRKIGGHDAYQHPHHAHGEHPAHSGQHQHYHIGVTMHDGSRHIITVPDISHLHRGDSVQVIDGTIGPQ